MTKAERYRLTMRKKPADRLIRREFGYMEGTLDRWKKEGLQNGNLDKAFCYDGDCGVTRVMNLGWCEPPFYPEYEIKVVRTEGEYEIVQDKAGRLVRYFRGKRNNFMPTYLKHAVAGESDWENDVVKRLDPDTPQRISDTQKAVGQAKEEVAETGNWLQQRVIGQFMYLRALFGPEGVMYAFYDFPDLVGRMLDHWVVLNDKIIALLQKKIGIDEIFFAEDICYKHGLLISPDMWRKFLKPRYLDLIKRVQARQDKKLFVQVDTDGNIDNAIPLYLEIGMDMISPCEAAAGADVVQIAKQYPGLVLSGGIDKRVLAGPREGIEAHLQYIIPFMRRRGGYFPTCDHMVPNEVSLSNYRFYRERILALGG